MLVGMRGKRYVLRLGVAAAFCAVSFLEGRAQQAGTRSLQVCVRDQSGSAIADVRIKATGAAEVLSDANGCAKLTAASTGTIEITRDGFGTLTQPVGTEPELVIVLKPAGVTQTVDVTATRTPLSVDATASSLRMLTSTEIADAPGLGLDDWLRQVAGFQLFRRTSSWVANPTTEGTSLRGLGSTAASRTLVLSDEVPLNDAFGGWIHWNEAPQLAIEGAELMRGGASDLYGSSAIGGVIDVKAVRPEKTGYQLDLMGATLATYSENALGTLAYKRNQALAAATFFGTDGYILIAPDVRGPVDINSNVHSQSGRVELRHMFSGENDVFLRGNVLNESRSNGTPLTPNGTRLWRYAAGTDWALPGTGRILGRFYGTDQKYRQNFSSVTSVHTNRDTEKLTKLQRVPAQQIGGAVQWAQSYRAFTFVAGADVVDTRGTDNETPVTNNVQGTTVSISARQRQIGGYGEVLWQPKNWSFALSTRGDDFRTFDAKQTTGPAVVFLPTIDEHVFDPRLGIVRKLGSSVSLTGSVFRAFRGPSMNELYRTGQVGSQTTTANPNLRSERATGWETGVLLTRPRLGSLRSSYFWTQVNRPIAAVSVNNSTTQFIRQNLGQIVSKGVTIEAESKPYRWLSFTAGYQYANSTVTKFSDPTLVGKWTAQVARNLGTGQVRLEKQRWGVLGVSLRVSGQQFDDSANTLQLAGYTQVDLYAQHTFTKWLQAYSSVQNVGGELVQAGRTPLLTLGIPRTVTFGIRIGSTPREP
jgi:outer membrane receptor protein involved in Fe transport